MVSDIFECINDFNDYKKSKISSCFQKLQWRNLINQLSFSSIWPVLSKPIRDQVHAIIVIIRI